jgi:hypothetical protein
MTLKENSNGSCFEAWLQEYKVRLQKVHLQACPRNGSTSVSASDAAIEQQEENKVPSSPAAAGDTYVLSHCLIS